MGFVRAHTLIGERILRAAPALSHAIAELQSHAGSQFDPDVVAAFVQVLASRTGVGTVA